MQENNSDCMTCKQKNNCKYEGYCADEELWIINMSIAIQNIEYPERSKEEQDRITKEIEDMFKK